MADERAKKIKKLWEREWSKNTNFRNLWQETADLTFPRENNITDIGTPGEAKTRQVYDTTAITDSKIMADGLASAIIPAGEPFFKFNVPRDSEQSEEYDDYLARAGEKLHIDLFKSNFLLQLNETLRSLVVFGTGNLFSEWTTKTDGLNYYDYDIALYQILENSKGSVDTILLKFPRTANQAYEEWGDKAGKSVIKARDNPDTENQIFKFIQIVRPRTQRNYYLVDFMNMPFESVIVSDKDEVVVDEGGFEEFPFHIPRWMKTSGETFGRGAGTEIFPQVKVLNRMVGDFIECANKHINPPLEVHESFDGEVNVIPNAINVVQQIPSIAAIDRSALGNFPIAEKEIILQREVVDKAFYKDVFVQLADLKGDRRTTVEIRQRIMEGLRRIGQPTYRIQAELLNTVIIRSLRLEIRNGQIPEPPPGLDSFDIEYLGLMANALSAGQGRAFQQWVSIGMQMEETYPGTKDNINVDDGFRDLGRSLGVKAEHINTPEERDAIRESRAEQLKQKQLLELGQAAAQGYSQTTGAPEEGSPAGELMEAASA